MTARDKGRVEKTGFVAARAAKDVEKEDSRCKALTADEAIVTMWMVMSEKCDGDKRVGADGFFLFLFLFLFHQMPRCE